MAWLVRNAQNRWLAPLAPSLWTLDPGSRIGGWPLWPPVSGLWTHDPELVAGPSGPQSLDSGPRIQNRWLAPLPPLEYAFMLFGAHAPASHILYNALGIRLHANEPKVPPPSPTACANEK